MRQADIEDYSIIWFGVAEEVPLLAVKRHVDSVPVLGQRFLELPVEVGVVFNDENAHPCPLLAAVRPLAPSGPGGPGVTPLRKSLSLLLLGPCVQDDRWLSPAELMTFDDPVGGASDLTGAPRCR